VAVNPLAEKLTKGVIYAFTCSAICLNLHHIMSHWGLLAPFPPILTVFILSVGFTGINFLADGVLLFLVFLASMQTILFWLKRAW